MTLRSRLILLVLATVLPLIAFAAITVALVTRQQRAAVERGAIETARAVLSAVDRQLAGSVTTLEALATSRHLDTGDLAAFYADAQRALTSQPVWRTIILASPSGERLLDLRRPVGDPLPPIVERRSLQRVVETGRPAVGGLVVNAIDGQPLFPVRVPVVRGGAVRYVLSAAVAPGIMADILTGQRLPADWIGSILDADHLHVARSPSADQFFGKPASPGLAAAVDRSREGWITASSLEGLPVYAAFSRSAWSGWTVAFGVPQAAVERPLHRSLALLVAGGVAFLVLGVGLALVVGRRIAAPIWSLVSSTEALGRGATLPPRPVSGLQEVDILSRAIEQASVARHRAEQALQETSDTLQALVQSSALGIVVTDLDGKVQVWNPAAEALLGWSRDEVIGRLPPHVRPEELTEFRRNFAPALRGEVFKAEVRRHRKDGTAIELSVATAPLRDAAGRTRGVVTVFADVTERNRAEEEREQLLARAEAARAEAERGRREAETIAELARTVNASLDLDVVLPSVAEAARLLCDADAARIALLDPAVDVMVLRYSTGAPTVMPPGFRIGYGKGIGGLAWATGGPVRSEDFATDPRFDAEYLPIVEADGIVSCMVVPIRIGPRVAGLVYVNRRRYRPFTEGDESVLSRLADQAAIAIRNAQLLASEQALRAEAERASRAKDEFLAMLGHELRNPLGAVSNAIAALERGGKPDEQLAELRGIIARQTQHLARLVDDLLDVSRVTSGKILLERRPVDLRAVAEGCLAALQHAGRTAAHKVTLSAVPVVVDGDPTRLEQVVANLLDNAVKYTPPGGRIGISVEAEPGEAVLRVRDTGIGIARDMLPHVFDVFVQGHRALNRPQGGLGLGLTLVKRLVELHGGRVAASSPGPGTGSEFVVRLPRAAAPAMPVAPATPDASVAGSCRIALVEDHRDAREGLRILLELWGHRVEEAEDGECGFSLIRASRPDVALVDLGLPRLDGYALARAIRGLPGGQGIYLVALTGYGQPEDRRRVEAAGFDAHLVKPVDPDDLQRILSAASAGRAA